MDSQDTVGSASRPSSASANTAASKRVTYGFTFQDQNGKQIRETDSSWTREDAEKAMAARLLNVAAPPQPDLAVITFEAMTERYLKEKEISRKRTVDNDRRIIKMLTAFFGEATPLTAITAPRIAEYRIKRLTTTSEKTGRNLEPGSVNRELSILRGLLRLAADEECGYLEKAPRVRLEREPQGRLRFLSDDESTRLLDECQKAAKRPVETCRSPFLYPVVVVALNTGMRKSEILNLEWDRINFSRGVVQLETTKNGTRPGARGREELPLPCPAPYLRLEAHDERPAAARSPGATRSQVDPDDRKV